jgi:hypothetical protein
MGANHTHNYARALHHANRHVVHINQTPSAMKITTQIDALMNAAANSANHFSEEVSDVRLARSD